MSISVHNAYQRGYYSTPERKPRMLPSSSPYVLRHLDAVLGALGPGDSEDGKRILEIGCGMGRFTRLLLERGYEVTAVDLSPDLLAVLEEYEDERLRCVCCDVAEVDRHVDGPFDAVVGFFCLHHLPELDPTFRSVAGILRPGGRMAFSEPNAFNPLFYLQILLTPGMTWQGDRGVARMRPGLLTGALRRAGLAEPRIRRYGMFPPFLGNTRPGAAVERWLERRRVLNPVLAFQVVSGTRGD